MDLGSILILLATLILVALFVGRPFFEKESTGVESGDTPGDPAEHERSQALAERDRILTALQELDFDNALGKIPEEEYPTQRAALMQRGAEILKRLDVLQPEATAEMVSDRLEAAIAARRIEGQRSPIPPSAGAGPDEAIEELIASRRRQREENVTGFCSRCGKPVLKSDRFCPKCGASL